MKENLETLYKNQPVLLDRVLLNIRRALSSKLKWLDFAFGRAYRLTENSAELSSFIYPAVYKGDGEYLSVLPNDNFGNFSWFDIYDPQKLIKATPALTQYNISGALIFWYDLRSIYTDNDFLYTEEVKNEIISVLTSPGLLSTAGHLAITDIYERPENIYKGYNLQKVDKQFFIYPYASLRIEFTITTRELCQRYTM